LKKQALYQGTASAVPIRLGFSPWFGNPGAGPSHPLEKTGAKALWVFPICGTAEAVP
jgi:hypothetical protein